MSSENKRMVHEFFINLTYPRLLKVLARSIAQIPKYVKLEKSSKTIKGDGMKTSLPKSFVRLLVVFALFFGLVWIIEKFSYFQNETGFVILADKVGHPTRMTIFRVQPTNQSQSSQSSCQVGGDKLYTPHNISIFTAAEIGDVLRYYRHVYSLKILNKVIWQSCEEMYMPLKIVTSYPDMGYWPFRKGDLGEHDPDYERIARLIKSSNN